MLISKKSGAAVPHGVHRQAPQLVAKDNCVLMLATDARVNNVVVSVCGYEKFKGNASVCTTPPCKVSDAFGSAVCVFMKSGLGANAGDRIQVR